MISHCYDVICYPIFINSHCLKTLGVDSLQDIGVLTETASQFPRGQFQVSVVLNLMTIIVAHGITDSITPNGVS